MSKHIDVMIANFKRLERQEAESQNAVDVINTKCTGLFIGIVKMHILEGAVSYEDLEELNKGYIDNLSYFIHEYEQIILERRKLFER